MRVEKEPEALVKYPVQGQPSIRSNGAPDVRPRGSRAEMKDASMSLGIYFEIKDAELYGGEGTTGYAATIVEISIEGLQN